MPDFQSETARASYRLSGSSASRTVSFMPPSALFYFALGFIGFTFCLKFMITERLAGGILQVALDLLRRA